MKKLKYHIASTLDGFIAHKDHTIDGFTAEGDHVVDYLNSLRTDYDTVLMGRRTYEFGFRYGVTNPYPWMKQYVITRSMQTSPDENVNLVSENFSEFVKGLKRGEGKSIYLCGGSELATHLYTEGLIDEIIIKLNPVVFGTGIPLFGENQNKADLELIQNKTYENGVLLLQYEIKNNLQ